MKIEDRVHWLAYRAFHCDVDILEILNIIYLITNLFSDTC